MFLHCSFVKQMQDKINIVIIFESTAVQVFLYVNHKL